jgi:hypothetical protein
MVYSGSSKSGSDVICPEVKKGGVVMEHELSLNSEAKLSQTDMVFVPSLVEDNNEIAQYNKIPLSRLPAYGTAFEPIVTALQQGIGGETTALYKVTIPKGTHLAEFKSGAGNLGTVLNSNNQIAGQARLNPVAFNPTSIFMAATLANIDKKLDAIQKSQQEMMDFIVQKEKSELKADLNFLTDILDNYKYNWNSEKYKTVNHMKVLDIRQDAGKKIDFYYERITAKLKKKKLVHGNQDVKKQLVAIQDEFKEYQLALYIYGFAYFLEVLLQENYDAEYLENISRKIEALSFQYRELYTRTYSQLEDYAESSVQSQVLKGFAALNAGAGKVIEKVPLISKSQLDETLIENGQKLSNHRRSKTDQTMNRLVNQQSSCVRPFIDNIKMVNTLYNNSLEMMFDRDAVYFPALR